VLRPPAFFGIAAVAGFVLCRRVTNGRRSPALRARFEVGKRAGQCKYEPPLTSEVMSGYDVRLPSIAHAWPMRSTLFNKVKPNGNRKATLEVVRTTCYD
jgi:hypothetical protein